MKISLKLRAIAVVSLIAVVVIGCGNPLLAGGKLHYSQDRFEKAKETLEAAVAETPNDAECHLWLAMAMGKLREDEGAVRELKLAGELVTERQPELKELIANTLVSFWSQRQSAGNIYAGKAKDEKDIGNKDLMIEKLEAAVDEYKRAILFYPDTVRSHRNLGQVYFQLDRRDEGMASFQRARELGSDDPTLAPFLFSVFRSLGLEALEIGNNENSVESYERAIEMFEEAASFKREDADQIVIYYNIGFANSGLASLAPETEQAAYLHKAEENYLKVIELDPGDVETFTSLADVYSNLRDFDKAIEYAQKLVDNDPTNHEAYLTMMTLYTKKDDRDKAAAYSMLRRVLRGGDAKSGGAARQQVSGMGPNSDMQKALLDRGIPTQIYDYVSSTRGTYNVWFFWGDGRVYIFQKGKEVFRGGFRALTDEEVSAVVSGGN